MLNLFVHNRPLFAGQQMLVLLDNLPVGVALTLLIPSHAIAVEDTFTPGPNLLNPLHGRQRLRDQVARVARRDMATAGERERCVDDHLFAGRLAEGFRPLELAGVAYGGEALLAG